MGAALACGDGVVVMWEMNEKGEASEGLLLFHSLWKPLGISLFRYHAI